MNKLILSSKVISSAKVFRRLHNVVGHRIRDFIYKSKEKKDPLLEFIENARNSFKRLQNSGSGNKNNPNRPDTFTLLTLAAVAGYTFYYLQKGNSQEIKWREFVEDFIKTGSVSEIRIINESHAELKLKSNNRPGYENSSFYIQIGSSAENFERDIRAIEGEMGIKPSERISISRTTTMFNKERVGSIVINVAMLVGLWYLMSYFLRGGGGMGGAKGNRGPGMGIFGMGQSTAKVVEKGQIKVKFNDVAGCEEAKLEIIEFVNFLRHPEKYLALGAKIPRGAILKGPPGTGKTLLAKATAGEANVPFLSVTGSEFVEMFVGVGSSRVRDMFKQARSSAPCILFIDEIDAIGRKRQSNRIGGNQEQENTLNQLLVEMDGFNSQDNVVVMAATNRIDILDKALLRPGRFDRQIYVSLPDIKGRASIFKVHMKPIKTNLDPTEVSRKMAARTPGFSGADIANVCNEAALIAARETALAVDYKHFDAAIDRVIGGLEKKTQVLQPDEKQIVAYHEAGHAVAAWFLKYCDPLLKVSIIPRGKALGYAQYQPRDMYLMTQDQMIDQMIMALAGRASEQIFFGRFGSGAMDDLQKVTRSAYTQIVQYGFSKKVGHLSFDMPSQRGEMEMIKPYSEQTAQIIDDEVREMVGSSYDKAIQILNDKKAFVEKVAKRLLDREQLVKSDLVEILGERPFKEKTTYDDFVEGTGSLEEDTEMPSGLKDWNKEDPKTEDLAQPNPVRIPPEDEKKT